MKTIILTEKEREALDSLLSQRAEADEWFKTRKGRKFSSYDIEILLLKIRH
uniref:Antitoxin n=1 Tax=viral metagenome TaxID=1070528 RepID=A0A6H1ZEH2_9ZZZZ